MREHTPGPWDRVIHGESESRVGAKTLIAIVYSEAFRDRANQEANARLIAAAPDLLAACEVVVAFLDGLESRMDPLDMALAEIRREVHAPLRAALEPAIAKAKGAGA